jgi:hypothetical protein
LPFSVSLSSSIICHSEGAFATEEFRNTRFFAPLRCAQNDKDNKLLTDEIWTFITNMSVDPAARPTRKRTATSRAQGANKRPQMIKDDFRREILQNSSNPEIF